MPRAARKSDADNVANKVLTRLIRGLCSSRKAARSGFFVALSESLRQLYGPSRKEIPEFEPNLHGLVKLVAELTKAEGKASGQEKRDHLLGRVFGYKALIQSSILVQPTAPKECWANVLEELYTISQQKSWVREECAMIFYDAVKAIHAESGDEKLVHQIIDGLCTHGLAKTPEGVAIWLTVQSTFPKLELPEGTWHKQDPLCTKERQTLANVMKENFAKAQEAENGKKVKSGSSQTTLNFAWEVVMLSFMQSHGAGESGVTGFSKFWTDIVDNNLFSASASPEQKSKGLQLFSRMLASAPQWALLPLFSPNLMRCIINQRNGSDRYLHKAAATPLDEMRARVKRNPDVAAPIVEGLITRHGSLSFDKITKTKTVEGVLGHASGSALEELVVFFKRLIYRPADEDEKAVEAYRRTISDMLVSLVRSRNLENPIGKDEWLRTLLDVFTTLAYFSPTGSSKTQDVPVPSVSEGSRNMFQQRLSSCLAHLLSSKLDTEMIYPMLVVAAIQNHSSSEELSLAFKAEKSITKAVKQAHKQLNEISAKEAKAKEKKKPALRAFKLLFSLTIIQVYNGDADAVMILDELSECYGAAFQKGEKDANAFQLLTEVILGFASRPSVLFRRLAEQVFTVFASELTPEGLQSMIEILEKKESVSGQQDLFDQQGSDVEEEGEEDEEDEEVDSDVEVVDADGSDVEMAEDESEDDKSGDDGESEDGDGDDEELQKFDALLAETLKTSAPNGTGEDENDSDDDDADMDDDEMMALEPHLTKIFQERQKANSTKKENKDAKENMINFKNRVLDLLLIYVKQQHGNPLAMDTIMPLLQLMRTTSTKQVSEKAANLLKQYFEAAKKGMPEPPETTPVWALLKDVHGEAAKDASKLFAGACSRASLFLAKILVNKKDKNFKKVVDVYAETMKQRHEDPNSKLHPSFFVEWVNWSFAPKKQKTALQTCRSSICQLSERNFEVFSIIMACKHVDAPGTCFHLQLRAPGPTQSVYREDCTQCFDSIDDPSGLDVCLYCFNGGCTAERNHALLHHQTRKHPLVVNIKRTRKKVKRDEPPQKMSKLAIAAETEADRYDTTTRVKCYECGVDDVDKTAGKLPQVVDAVLKANTFARQEEVKAWEQEMIPCEHTLCLEQDAARTIASQDLGHCSMCDLKENLWLCLTCGNLGCGRAQFGGIGGNSHGLAHTDATGHPVAVKLGSLTADGTADIYCYACNEERVDPELVAHLANWGIDIASRQKTEKSLTEMQIEQNLRWEFSMQTEDGKELKPLFGPGFTGLKNLGNSCYLASVLQALFAMPEFQRRYYHPDEKPPQADEPAQDLETQLRKMADGLLSGRYSKPDCDVIVSENTPEVPHQKGLAPAMLKHLIGRGHAEFSTMRQQDSFELLLHLLKLVTRSQHVAPLKDPVDAFRFAMEQRLQCINCKKVSYKTDEMENISIPVPIRRIPKDDKMDITDAEGKEKAKEEFEPVTLKECLDIFTAVEAVELTCAACGSKDGFTKQSLFKTFPDIMAVNARRFELVNWVPTKLDVPVVIGDEAINFDSYKSAGLREGEELLPEDADTGSSSKFVPNETALAMLEAMGFPRVRCEKALHATGNSDPEAASNWLFGHMDDPDIDTPVDLGGGGGGGSSAGSGTVDPEKIESLGAMGFGAPQARQALKETGGDMERAVDWLFNHPEATGDFGDDADGDGEAADVDAIAKEKKEPGSGVLPANFQLHSIVCHKGSSIHAGHYVAFIRKQIPGDEASPSPSWVLFNDEKVAKAADVDEMKKFAYVYFFRRV
ncbi:hypothetical protein BKA81DRAFT_386032 [Phyllosticta paracitricarpa]